MTLLIQFVILAAFVVSCYCYSVSRKTTHSSLDTPIEFDDLDNKADGEYPQDYVDKLLSELSPEDLKKYKIDSTLAERQGNPGAQFCSSSENTKYPRHESAVDDHMDYYVIQPKTVNKLSQKFTIHVCNSVNNHCFPNATIPTGYIGCCVMQNEVRQMHVLSVPIALFSFEKPRGTIIKKNIYLSKASCSCVMSGYILDFDELASEKECR